jgi:hypothetical protein
MNSKDQTNNEGTRFAGCERTKTDLQENLELPLAADLIRQITKFFSNSAHTTGKHEDDAYEF